MPLSLEGVDTVLLDIEGTVCPISFVKETLFPYALKALPKVLADKWDDPDFQQYKDAFPESARSSPKDLEDHVKKLTDKDVKVASLKNLQGYLWQAGYEEGAYSTPLFSDVAPQLQKWKDSSLQLAIYSSGSIFAQKLLFGHVKASDADDANRVEDLKHLIGNWFDTTNAGPKLDASSYTKIASEIEKPTKTVLFLSDNVKEVRAAIEAGMQSVLVDRPGNAPLTDEDRTEFQIVETLSEIALLPTETEELPAANGEAQAKEGSKEEPAIGRVTRSGKVASPESKKRSRKGDADTKADAPPAKSTRVEEDSSA